MASESVCQVARSWADVGSFHTRLFIIFMIFTASVRNILDIPSYVSGAFFQMLLLIFCGLIPAIGFGAFSSWQ
jgi:hypothetical protein